MPPPFPGPGGGCLSGTESPMRPLGPLVSAHAAAGGPETQVPIVCRACSRVQHLGLSRLRASTVLACAGCGAQVNLAPILATVPKRIVQAEARGALAERPLSEFP